MKICSTGLGKQQRDTGFEYYPGRGSRIRQSLGTDKGIRKESGIQDSQFSHNLGSSDYRSSGRDSRESGAGIWEEDPP